MFLCKQMLNTAVLESASNESLSKMSCHEWTCGKKRTLTSRKWTMLSVESFHHVSAASSRRECQSFQLWSLESDKTSDARSYKHWWIPPCHMGAVRSYTTSLNTPLPIYSLIMRKRSPCASVMVKGLRLLTLTSQDSISYSVRFSADEWTKLHYTLLIQ